MKAIKNFIITASLLAIAITLAGCDPQTPQTSGDALAIRDNDHIKGSASAPVTIVEYSDFQCPACSQAHPIIKQLREDFPNDVKVIYRHFPLEYHAQAIPAARAAEAAGKQGKFFEMHDKLFENQDEWEGDINAKETFSKYAEELGLDMKKYKEDYSARSTLKRIESNRDDDKDLDILGTPTLYMNGEKIALQVYPEFKKVIEEAIANPKTPSQPAGEQPL